MEQTRRVTTVKKPKKIVTILLIFIGILGIALIGVAIYFYLIKEGVDDKKIDEKTCGCYFIDPAVVSECGDPRRAFIFNIAKTPYGETCKASCVPSSINTNLLNSDTQQNLYKSCSLDNIQDTRCNEMTIKDKDGKIVTGKISPEDIITVEAKFDKEYTNHQIIVNNEPSEPDTVSADKLTIKKELSQFTKTSLNIVASATTPTGDTINSPICRRLIDIEQTASSSVNNLMITSSTTSGTFKLTGMNISVGNIDDSTKLALRFSFDTKKHQDITMQKGFTLDSAKGEISILERDLYDTSNFADGITFAQLDKYDGEVLITVKVNNLTDSTTIGETSKKITFVKVDAPQEQQPETIEESNFKVTLEGSISCIERVTPNNRIIFTATVLNNGKIAQSINSIKNKLPLGFTYIAESSKINGVAVKDNDYLKQTTIGDTKELVWSKTDGWTISPSQTLVITFTAEAGANAITGNNQNEVVITPEQIPTDPNLLRADAVVQVAQDCTNPDAVIPSTPSPTTPTTPTPTQQPQTGIFDSAIVRIIVGLAIVLIGWYVQNKPFGRVVAKKLTDSGFYKDAEMTSLKVFKPKEYFERKTIKRVSKRN
ncbi:MAG: hypothetical protein ACOX6Q_02370 [Candidatus Dojkabacteria bacterium]|jgi:uncharacterized repeat protein (TIGR01451 family)